MNTNINNYASDEEDIEEEDLIIQASVTASISTDLVTLDYSQRYYNKITYHDSALSGAVWVCELLRGHPKHICKELGVHKHVFQDIIVALQDTGHTQSKFVTLEEQLAIFLYSTSVAMVMTDVFRKN